MAGLPVPPLWLRIFLLSAALVVLVAATALAVAWRQGARIAGQELSRALATSIAVQREFEQRRLEQLEFMVQQFAADASLVTYIADAGALAFGLDGQAASGGLSIRDLLLERREVHDFDLAIVLDEGAVVLARTDSSEFFAEDLRDDPLVGAAHDALTPYSGYWRLDDALYQAAIVPLQQDRDLVGFLLLAVRVDDAFASRIAGVSGAQIAFLLDAPPGRVIASSLAPEVAAGLPAALAQATPGGDATGGPDRLELQLGEHPWMGRLMATAGDAQPALGQVLTLASSRAATAAFRQFQDSVLLAGLASLALALLLSLLLSKGVLRPLRRLAEATESAAAGNYRAEVAVGGRDELGRLSRGIDSLLASLREKSDIESYLGDLARALPEGGDAPSNLPTTRAVPRTLEAVLLAVRLPTVDEDDRPEKVFALDQEGVNAALASAPGALVAIDGVHVLMACPGEDGLDSALRALAALRQRWTAGRTAAVLHVGRVLHGDLRLTGASALPVVAGPAAELAGRLLSQVAAGGLLLTPAAAARCRTGLGAAAVVVARGPGGAPFLSLRPQALPSPAAPVPVSPGDQAAPVDGPVAGSGSVLGHRYQVISLLGSGGMGAVYKVRDLELDEVIALKMLRADVAPDATQRERLKDEIRLARRITHGNVLRTFDYVEIDGGPCISMEFVRGMTLRYLLSASGRIPPSAGLRIARQLAAGLVAAHAVGVLHRDIKPENIILETSGNAKLMDFGIARPVQRQGQGHTEIGSFVGTPRYAAPEQMAGDAVGPQADIYALGVVMCEMFGGHLPHEAANTMDLYVAKMREQPVPPSARGIALPAGLEAIVLRCLALHPDDRFGSAQALQQALAGVRA
ncbi:MAG: protein kinase [Xanthomonadales bacterium]|nr:protein kinase [Xanthomonadales bacterium]